MGPLSGYRVIEVAGIGPGPFAAMMLSDMGAEVLRLERGGDGLPGFGTPEAHVLNRGRRSAAIDLKSPEAAEVVLRLVEVADALIEGFRPGVAERLGIGPDACLTRNPRLVYGRMTGYGQDGPMAQAAGHDIDYIAMAGALDPIGRAGERPVPPLNLVADFGGGGMFLAFGVCCALLERHQSGRGQVVDAAMVDGAAVLTAMFHGMRASGLHRDQRGTNLLDTGAPFYDVYETADGRHLAVGALEPQFYAALLGATGLDQGDLPAQMDRSAWPAVKERMVALFRTRTRDEWVKTFEGVDACVAPVLSLGEAPQHPHNQARGTFVDVAGVTQPAPAPRFSRTPGAIERPPAAPGTHTDEALADWGFSADEIAKLRSAAVLS
ncbi:MAG: CaiB/BaiF CoA transferase family protein [Acidimicrobiia bacterium]